MEKPVVIFGAGSFAEVAAAYLSRDSSRVVVAYTVDRAFMAGDEFAGLPVIAFEDLRRHYPPAQADILVATGFSRVNAVRRELFGRCRDAGYEFVRYVNSRAVVMNDAPVRPNTFIFELNVIQPFVEIGENVVIWSGNHIGHHSVIADHCFIASHAVISGNVTIGESCFIGVNATVRDGVTIGPRCVVGAGALVLGDLEEGSVLASAATPVHRRKSWELRHF